MAEKLSGNDYKQALENITNDNTLLLFPTLPSQAPTKRRRVDPDIDGGDLNVLPKLIAEHDSEIDGGSDLEQPVEEEKEIGMICSNSHGNSSSSSSATNQTQCSPHRHSLENHIGANNTKNTGDEGLRATCFYHIICRNLRGLDVDMVNFGEMVPYYYLDAWVRVGATMPPRPPDLHKDHRRSRAAMRAFMERQ